MAKIAHKNILIEFQLNNIDEHGDIVDCDHLKVFIGKNRFCPITDSIAYGKHSTNLCTLSYAISYCETSDYNDIEVLVTAISSDGNEILREYVTIDDERVDFYNGDYVTIPACVRKEWKQYSHDDINKVRENDNDDDGDEIPSPPENNMDFFNVIKHMVFDDDYNPIDDLCEVVCPNCREIHTVSREGWSAICCLNCGASLHTTDFNLDDYYTHGDGEILFVFFRGKPISQVETIDESLETIKSHFLERNPRWKNNQFFDEMAYSSFYGL